MNAWDVVLGTLAEEARLRLQRLRSLLEAKEYFDVGASARFRAVHRRVTWQASRAAMLVIGFGAPLHVVVLTILHPSAFVPIAMVDTVLAAAAALGWWCLGGVLRHWPEPVAFVMSLAVGAAAMLLAVSGPHLVALAVGYLLFIPPVVALVVPWRSQAEVRWLAVYGAAVMVFLATVAPDGWPAAAERRDLVVALLVSLAAAFTGHALVFRRQVRSFAQVQALGRLQRRETRQWAELQRVHSSLEVIARTDDLTGTGNRKKLDEDLRIARGRLARTGGRFGLLEIDLDHFKAINDTFGHVAGDEILRRVSSALRDAVRSDDAVYRFGGEEFLVLLGNVSGGVLSAGERVREAVEDLGLLHPANAPFEHVTVSVGASLISRADLAASNDEWFSRVDVALYQAKADGRNRVAVAQPTAAIVEVRTLRANAAPVPRVPSLQYLP